MLCRARLPLGSEKDVFDWLASEISVECFDWDRFSKNDSLGLNSLSMRDIVHTMDQEISVELLEEGVAQGALKMQFHVYMSAPMEEVRALHTSQGFAASET